VVFATGISAISGLMLQLLSPGDHRPGEIGSWPSYWN
jgi:hypothetical protein